MSVPYVQLLDLQDMQSYQYIRIFFPIYKAATLRMQAFFQGKVDNFCAAYAVLNALQVLFGVTVLHARKIFNRTLLAHSSCPAEFSAILDHKTDYVAFVDAMLSDIRENDFPTLCIKAPFSPKTPCQKVWDELRNCSRQPMPLISVFRFLRFVPGTDKPYVDHWTVGHYMDLEGLHFLDCSIEQSGLYCLPYEILTDPWRPLARDYVVIPPESVRILSVTGSTAILG
jgi:hypothetical protein